MQGDAAPRGFTLVEALIVTLALGVGASLGIEAWRRHAETRELTGAAAAVRGVLGRARMLGVARRRVVKVTADGRGDLVVLDGRNLEAGRVPTRRDGPFRLDSVRIRPRTLRFNARGQAAPGSVYLYRGGRGVRLVSNFLGRVRQEWLVLR